MQSRYPCSAPAGAAPAASNIPAACTGDDDPGGSFRGPRLLAAAAASLFLGASLAYACYIVFSRSLSIHERYLMITIQGFLEGNALYDSVFTHYGPFYYAYEWVWH